MIVLLRLRRILCRLTRLDENRHLECKLDQGAFAKPVALAGRIRARRGLAAGIEMRGEIPTLCFGCSVPEFRKSQPNNLLYWTCIKWCKQRNYKIFDLGGWQINAQEHLQGVNRFKENHIFKDFFIIRSYLL